MSIQKNTLLRFFLIVAEILLITYLDYKAGPYYSLSVFYCLPVLQAARLSAIRANRRSDSKLSTAIAVLAAVGWSAIEANFSWPDYPINALLMNIFTRSVVFTVIGRVVARLWKDREFARKDALTDLDNRLEFFDVFETEQSRSQRSGKPYSLLFIDIDQFKLLNDDHGHHTGDNALIMLAEILRENSRRFDTIVRFGGDEFVLLLPETDEQSCEVLVNRIRQTSEKSFQTQGWSISLSIGHVTETGKNKSADELLREADSKMYIHKKAKRH